MPLSIFLLRAFTTLMLSYLCKLRTLYINMYIGGRIFIECLYRLIRCHYLGHNRANLSVLIVVLVIFSLLPGNILKADTVSFITQAQLKNIIQTYNARAGKRLTIWNKMMLKAQGLSELEQLKLVNNYFNRIKYLSDKKHWGKSDYWATAFEFIGSGAGDCEDFATAKYFSLKLLGVADKKLQLSYVKLKTRSKKYESNHMVLSYFTTADADPIILDNVNLRLKLASQRADITPVFSFNASSLLKSKNRGKKSKAERYNLANWQKLLNK